MVFLHQGDIIFILVLPNEIILILCYTSKKFFGFFYRKLLIVRTITLNFSCKPLNFIRTFCGSFKRIRSPSVFRFRRRRCGFSCGCFRLRLRLRRGRGRGLGAFRLAGGFFTLPLVDSSVIYAARTVVRNKNIFYFLWFLVCPLDNPTFILFSAIFLLKLDVVLFLVLPEEVVFILCYAGEEGFGFFYRKFFIFGALTFEFLDKSVYFVRTFFGGFKFISSSLIFRFRRRGLCLGRGLCRGSRCFFVFRNIEDSGVLLQGSIIRLIDKVVLLSLRKNSGRLFFIISLKSLIHTLVVVFSTLVTNRSF